LQQWGCSTIAIETGPISLLVSIGLFILTVVLKLYYFKKRAKLLPQASAYISKEGSTQTPEAEQKKIKEAHLLFTMYDAFSVATLTWFVAQLTCIGLNEVGAGLTITPQPWHGGGAIIALIVGVLAIQVVRLVRSALPNDL
jgi:hypothetical protein